MVPNKKEGRLGEYNCRGCGFIQKSVFKPVELSERPVIVSPTMQLAQEREKLLKRFSF